ncbi:hypothetical protein HLH26_06325 [Gluconacetobacter sp. 1b LMG 1731]|uniref:Uncharacterized protein n=1 Tax=Gluconacetobacter dulcium TaxID=2729096 RepID=A0A7W4NV95_9PROT|nr:hypothetical protein [Gluconacetobacter dulcium]MBB2164160.1 hypothetical protein [Gluconacetobacter dulcium]MBB2193432.1 hypothetical protein [Gluconacetobacter dulcium]
MENDYVRAGRMVLKDASPVAARASDGTALFAATPTPDGSLNAEASQWACGAAKDALF